MRRARPLVVLSALALRSAAACAQDSPPGVSWSHADLHGTLSAYLQAELQAHQGSESRVSDDGRTLLQRDRFLVRRANVYADVRGRHWSLAIETSANTLDGPSFGLSRALATLRWPERPGEPLAPVALSVGLFRVPFGWQNRVGSRAWGFAEATLGVRAFFPGQSDLGGMLHGAVGWLRYELAVMNGHPVGDRSFPLLAPSGPQDVVGRVGVALASRDRGTRFEAGVSALAGQGFNPGAPATADTIAYRDTTQTGVIDPNNLVLVPGRPAVAAQTFARWALGVDAVVSVEAHRRWRFTAFAEAALAQNLDRSVNVADPIASSGDLRELAWAFGTMHTLWDHALVGVRIDGYDPNADALTREAGRVVPTSQGFRTTTVLVGWAFDATNRLLVQYDHLDDHLALDAAGRPTDLRNDTVTARLQVGL